ncbi:ArsC family reductase [Hydrocarboniclastica marina]|uniref:ArsC family reductase n=1 Tax=Hydrocarboniclastica marina TaxID=2259620 RepID=A0A4P7XHE9_9ALTE|nr:ArsC family reductase [Hydrocarboniclastica marina]QCF26446.1 ArsC family reductase [Hydrocarboniclastica marina]
MITVFGIKNCDTIKKTKAWLEANEVPYQFHDYRKDGIDQALLERLESRLGWEALLNRRGTTWRKLPETVRDNIDRQSALAAMLEQPAMIKRPIVIDDNIASIGFDAANWENTLKA